MKFSEALLPRAAALAAMVTALGLAGGAFAQSSAALNTRALAATCANCHGTDGRAVAGQAMPALAGLPKESIVAQMRAFRDGSRPATVMHQIAKGYNDAQIDAIATYFAARQ